ncbi:MAG: hypothetical protein WB952_23285 [Terriglobales bacterium]
MHILYISGAQGPDYLCDMLFHGLRSELGADVVDSERIWYMYAGEFGEGRHDRSKLYGRGFTVYGLLGSDSSVDRTDLERKILAKYFDLVVYGSIQRCSRFLREVLLAYPPEQILFVDGEDHTAVISQLLGRGIYFKRELSSATAGVWPIQFAIPQERIGTAPRPKLKLQAFVDPRDTRTYIHQNEASYYGDYAESLFGVTMKKAGWDCLRHYEIMANGCVPWFLDLDKCSPTTMVFLPRQELLQAKKLLDSRGVEFFGTREGLQIWLDLQQQVELILRRQCTTRAMARYVIETVLAMTRQLPVATHPTMAGHGATV